ncbi:helix-turn-helix transcriptional regulator [Kutzneria kofuensis]|uniref:Transcriptional regulator with XRE-family HTH domain n=1 Tax=Kutzneria kofuensis TaxID=103725 RepID=A0A7W9NEI6_9PSEU|nr:helix-turn-helix domain-containing protein [Kutzneria kofuensis]MBB5889191.1 transcriptional regulator with XRE-family HTH domain [Kutzneria kofuensis]
MTNRLGDYLRARREQVRPADVGLPAGGGRRRVRGLRREELALLAGISSDYYMRLEQGRDQHPSGQVLDALATVLRLDPEATAYLHELARPVAPWRSGQVPASILQLIASWPATPAYVQDRLTNVVAANQAANALAPCYSVGVNLMRTVFLDPAEREFRLDWDETVADGVAILRASFGADLDDPDLVELVQDLSARSERFRELWALHEVKARAGHMVRFAHPVAGELELHSEKLPIASTSLTLVVFHAEAGTTSAAALERLTAGQASPA